MSRKQSISNRLKYILLHPCSLPRCISPVLISVFFIFPPVKAGNSSIFPSCPTYTNTVCSFSLFLNKLDQESGVILDQDSGDLSLALTLLYIFEHALLELLISALKKCLFAVANSVRKLGKYMYVERHFKI